MSFPLYVEKYTIGPNSSIYRRNPYNCSNRKRGRTAQASHDTLDLHADDEPTCRAEERVDVETHKETATTREVKKEVLITEAFSVTEDPRVFSNGVKWTASIAVPDAFMGKFVGVRGQARRELEDSTNCRLRTPRRGEKVPVEIASIGGLECVQRCLDRIELFLIEMRKKARVTHFVCIPCNFEQVATAFERFSKLEAVVSHESCRNALLFTKKHKLHVTISVLWLFTEEELETAKDVLQKVGEEIRGSFKLPLTAAVEGVDIMNDDPHNVQVLYAKVKGQDLQGVVDAIKRRLVEAGLARPETADGTVKLHVTLMNARYVTQATARMNYKFDASKILEELKDFHFGTVAVDEVCLCPLNKSVAEGNFYPKILSVKLGNN